jgi:hypothetical protein
MRPMNGMAASLPIALALWPAVFPMWFPEMARVGNDSLVALAAAGIAVIAAALVTSARIALYALLGLTLGIGLITKATLVPVAASASVLLALLVFRERADVSLFRRRLLGLATFLVTTVAVCGGWYALKYIETGNPIGSHDIAQMAASGGMIEGLRRHFQLFDLARAPWGWAMTFLWGSTWSYVVPPRAFMVGLAGAAVALGFGCYWFLRRNSLTPLLWFALLTLAFFMASLAYHTAVVISFDGGISPAWYLHALAPILAPLVAAGIAGLVSLPFGAGVLAAVIGYPLGFLGVAVAVNALYFAGCGAPSPGRVYFVFSSARGCAGDLSAIYANLSVLSYPHLATAMFITGWLLYGIGAVLAVRHLERQVPHGARAMRI